VSDELGRIESRRPELGEGNRRSADIHTRWRTGEYRCGKRCFGEYLHVQPIARVHPRAGRNRERRRPGRNLGDRQSCQVGQRSPRYQTTLNRLRLLETRQGIEARIRQPSADRFPSHLVSLETRTLARSITPA
jgi:hypothetical protein